MSESKKSPRKARNIAPPPDLISPQPRSKRREQPPSKPPASKAKNRTSSVSDSVTKSVASPADADVEDMDETLCAIEEFADVAESVDDEEVAATLTAGKVSAKVHTNDSEIDFALSGLSQAMGTGVLVPLVLGNVCIDGSEMLVLAQLVYWSGISKNGGTRARVKCDGYFWVAKTYEQLAAETGLSYRQARHAVGKLVRRGVLCKQSSMFGGLRSNFLRIRTEALAKYLPQSPALNA